MTEDKPRKIWLQVYDQEGNYMTPEDRTFSANERVNPTDICYVRWGKTDILSIERDAALARAEAAEAETADAINDLKIVTAKLARAERANALLAARVAELEARAQRHAQDYDALHQDYEKMRRNWEGTADIGAALATAEARVAELEAAQGWRPVTEKPPQTAQYQVAVMHGNSKLIADHMAYYLDSGWAGTDVIFWRPIPPLPAPQEPQP